MRVTSFPMLIEVAVVIIPRWWPSVAISVSISISIAISIGSSRFGGRSEPSYVELLSGVHRENLLHLLVEFRSRFRAMTVDRYPFAKPEE